MRESFYSPRRAEVIRNVLEICDWCQRNKIPTQASQALQEPVLSQELLELISIDFFVPLTRTKQEYEYLLVMTDTSTKYTKPYSLRKATSETAIKKLDEFTENVGALR